MSGGGGGGGGVKAGDAYVVVGAKTGGVHAALSGIQARMQAIAAQATALGTSFVKAGALITGPMLLSARTFANFEDQMLAVKAKSGAVGKEFDMLSEKAKELGANTSFTAKEVAQGMDFMAMAGFDAQQIMSGIPDVLNLARAGMLDLGRASDIVTDVGSAFKFTADELGIVADVIAKTATSANTSVELMGNSMKYVAPVARVAGQSIQETATAIGLLGNVGIKGSMAGTSLSAVFRSLADAGKRTRIEDLGVKVRDATGEFLPLLDIMRNMGNATRNLPGPERLAIFNEVFGARGAKAALNLADMGDEIDRMRGEINAFEGSAASMAKTMDSGIGGAFRMMMSAFEGLQLAIGEAISGPLTEFMNWLKDVFTESIAWVKENQKLVIGIAKLGAALTALGAALIIIGGAVKVFAFLTTPIGLAVVAVLALAEAFGVVNLGIAETVGNFKIAGQTIQTWMTATWLALLQGWEYTRNALATGWDFIVKAVQEAGAGIFRIWATIAEAMASTFATVVNSVVSGLNTILEGYNSVAGMISEKLTISPIDPATGQQAAKQAAAYWQNAYNESAENSTKRWDEFEADRQKRARESAKQIETLEMALTETFRDRTRETGEIQESTVGSLAEKVQSALTSVQNAFTPSTPAAATAGAGALSAGSAFGQFGGQGFEQAFGASGTARTLVDETKKQTQIEQQQLDELKRINTGYQ